MNIRLEFNYPEDEDNLKKFVQAVGGREWVGLTDDEIRKLAKENIFVLNAIIATNAKLKEKNT